MDLIFTAWRGVHNPPQPNPAREPIDSAQWPGTPHVPNDPAQMIGSTYEPGNLFEGGRTVQIPANYGTEGGLVQWEWTPTRVGPPPQGDPRIPQWNLLVPIRWNLQVVTDESLAVRGPATLTQVPSQESAQFTPPATASITFD